MKTISRISPAVQPSVAELALVVPFAVAAQLLAAPGLPIVKSVEAQPFTAQIKRLIEAMEYSGAPFDQKSRDALDAALARPPPKNINPEMRVKVARGPAKPELVEQGWRQFLVKVENEAGVTAPLRAKSPNAQRLHGSPAEDVRNRWLDLALFDSQPMQPTLSGLKLEYRIVQLYSRDAGKARSEVLLQRRAGDAGPRLPQRSGRSLQLPAGADRTLRVRDENNQPTTAAFIIRDTQGRVYPSQAKRLAPDFAFHPQVYRADGEKLKLPDGDYTVEFSRGPESRRENAPSRVDRQAPQKLEFKPSAGSIPAKLGWWSGDHHIHAAGCAHYVKPTEGVLAAGHDAPLPGRGFEGRREPDLGAVLRLSEAVLLRRQDDKVSQYPYLLRYDIEVTGFGSHQAGIFVCCG